MDTSDETDLANIDIVCKAVNERKALMDSNRELLEALKMVNEQIDLHIKHKDVGIGWLETAKETIQTAIKQKLIL